MPAPKIPEILKDAGFGRAEISEIATALDRKPGDVIDDVVDAVDSGCADVASVVGYIKPAPRKPSLSEQAAAAPPPKAGFNLAGYIGQLSDAANAALVPAGRYAARINDVKIGAEANDLGLRYAVFELEIIDHSEADPIPLFAAVDVDETLLDSDGLPRGDMDPVVRARFLGGLSVVEKLIQHTDVTNEEMADADSVDDALTLFIGCELKVAITKGRDRDGLPCNKVKTIIGGVGG